jgi:hypothetical protein
MVTKKENFLTAYLPEFRPMGVSGEPVFSAMPTQRLNLPLVGAGGHEQVITNSVWLKPAFAKRDKKQTMNDLQGIATNGSKNWLCPTRRLSRLWGLD